MLLSVWTKESQSSLFVTKNVGKSTVNDWRRNRKSIQDFCTQIELSKTLSTHCTLRKPANELVNDFLWLWFQQERRRGTPLSGPILKEKALLLHSKIEDGGQFSASEGWLTRWKKRHGVHFIGVCAEKLSADALAASKLPTKFQDYITERGLHPEQVYNMDETGLNFKLLPQKTFATSQEKSAPGFKTNKERLTVGVCSNASGTHKIPLFVIGKSKKLRALKNVNMSSLPVHYRAQKSAWMDSYLFTEWFVTEFVPEVKKHLTTLKLPIKAVLVIDNAPTHPEELTCEDEITIYFLPPHVTSLLQPMDQGVIASLKRRYRHKLLSEILSKLNDKDTGLIAALKTINIKDVIYMLAKAYEEMPNTTFTKSWRKLWPSVLEAIEKNKEDNRTAVQNTTEAPEPDDTNRLIDLQKLPECGGLSAEDVNEWVTADESLENEFLSDDDIVQAVSG